MAISDAAHPKVHTCCAHLMRAGLGFRASGRGACHLYFAGKRKGPETSKCCTRPLKGPSSLNRSTNDDTIPAPQPSQI
jgi:hypothetical protein